jgi:hypothetical protein
MGVFVIDPATQEIRIVEVEGLDFLDFVRREISAPQVAVLPVADNRFAVWCDSMGMLKTGRAFWRFTDNEYRFAGRCIITAINPDNGMMANFDETFTVEGLRDAVTFHPSDDLIRIKEEVVIVRDAEGRPTPAIARRAQWREEPAAAPVEPPAEDQIGSGWTISEREDGTYKAERYALQNDALRLVAMLSAPNLDDLRAQLPRGLVRIEADEREENVVEHWMVPVPE